MPVASFWELFTEEVFVTIARLIFYILRAALPV